MLKPWSTTDLVPEFAAEQAASPRELSEFADWFAQLAELSNPDASALARGKARLLAAVSAPAERFAPLFDKLERFFDLNREALRALFTRAADANEWQPGPLPSVSLFHLQGGPTLAGLDTGLVRLQRGSRFPAHRHSAAERVLILQGGYHDHEQRWYGPGDIHEMSPGSEHALQMNADRDVLLAVILHGEIAVIGA